jgi:hypothetical protein
MVMSPTGLGTKNECAGEIQHQFPRPDPTRPDPTRLDPTRLDPTRPDPTRPYVGSYFVFFRIPGDGEAQKLGDPDYRTI